MAAIDTSVMFGSGYERLSDPYATQGTSFHDDYDLYASDPDPDSKTWVPPTPASPGSQDYTVSSTTVKRVKNSGWNTSARSIATLEPGKCCRFNIASGVEGAILGVAPKGRDGYGPSSLSHAIVCDVRGVHIHENGEVIKTLKNQQTSVSQLRIHRQMDGTIVYVATTGTETLVYTSQLPLPTFVPMYIYGLLYSTGDRVLDAEFMGNDVLYGSC